MIGAGIGDWIHKVYRVINRKVLVGLREISDVLIGSPHVTKTRLEVLFVALCSRIN